VLIVFEIWGLVEQKIQELSKGMAQKIQFIVTCFARTKLLIFDEPFSGFDPINCQSYKGMKFSARERAQSIYISTHRMESVEEFVTIRANTPVRKLLDGKA